MFVKIPKLIQFFFPSIVWKKENSQKNIWLTFDDGPSPKATSFILKILKEEQIKATFFLVGQNIKKYPKLLYKIIDEGHKIFGEKSSFKIVELDDVIYSKEIKYKRSQKLAVNA